MASKLLEELSPHRHWLLYRKEAVTKGRNKGKITKVPYQLNGHKGSPTNSQSWTTYDKAYAAVEAGRFDGIGYALTADEGYICIDLDHCVNPKTGDIDPWAMDILDIVQEAGGTYSESSPSKTGIHLWGRGRLPNNKGIHQPMENGHDVEMYTNAHYMTVTGEPMNDIPLNDIQPAIDKILAMLKKKPTPEPKAGKGQQTATPALNLSDDEIITRIRKSKQGPKFHSLYDLGDMSEYDDDHNRADAALLAMLAFWTGKNAEQMERIFLSSKLAEDLDRKKGHKDDYLKNRSIKSAIESTDKVYDPKGYAAQKQDEELAAIKAEFGDKSVDGTINDPKSEKQTDDGKLTKSAATPQFAKRKPVFLANSDNKLMKCKENLARILLANNITIRKNIVTKTIDVQGSKELESLDYNSQATSIRNMTTIYGVNLSKQDTNDFLDLIADENSYSPVCDYLMDCYKNYDGKDYITPLFNMLSLDTEIPQDVDFCKILFIKWLLECAIIPFNRKTMRKLATQQGVLVLVGGQGVGKTRFPLNTILKDMPEYLITGETIEPKDKDSVLRAIGCWIFELAEFSESSTAKQQDALKSFIDREKDKIRPPYAHKAIDEPRTCVFYGTTNRTEFMYDPTGGRRWWPLAVTKINIDEDFNARQLWGQVMHLWKDEHKEPYPLTEEETKKLKKHNNNFSAQSNEELAISEYLDFDMPQEKWKWVSPAKLSNELNGLFLNRNYKPEATGVALTAMCRKNPQIEKRRTKKGIEYHLPFTVKEEAKKD
nr:VapE domain-containing protein [uncultured Dialister sp.]